MRTDLKLVFANNKHEIRQYLIKRDETDIQEILKKEIEFNSFILNDVRPPLRMKLAI